MLKEEIYGTLPRTRTHNLLVSDVSHLHSNKSALFVIMSYSTEFLASPNVISLVPYLSLIRGFTK